MECGYRMQRSFFGWQTGWKCFHFHIVAHHFFIMIHGDVTGAGQKAKNIGWRGQFSGKVGIKRRSADEGKGHDGIAVFQHRAVAVGRGGLQQIFQFIGFFQRLAGFFDNADHDREFTGRLIQGAGGMMQQADLSDPCTIRFKKVAVIFDFFVHVANPIRRKEALEKRFTF
jgi:hypothetical protein